MSGALSYAAALLSRGEARAALELARTLPDSTLTAAAAALRLGEVTLARELLVCALPSARRSLLLTRATWLQDPAAALHSARQVRQQARREGDAPALIAAVTLLAETQLLLDPDPFLPLRTLAEGLKVSEMMGQPADAHLLSALATAQRRAPRKADRLAEHALERAGAGSPARIGALLTLGQREAADQERERAELDARWLRAFTRP